MANQNFVKLYSQGRSFSSTQAWTPEQNEACLMLQKEGELQATEAAEFVRNGIMTMEDYKKAQKADFVPKSFEEVQRDAVAAHQADVAKELGLEAPAEVEEEAPAEVVEEETVESPKETLKEKKVTKKK